MTKVCKKKLFVFRNWADPATAISHIAASFDQVQQSRRVEKNNISLLSGQGLLKFICVNKILCFTEIPRFISWSLPLRGFEDCEFQLFSS